MADPRFPSFYRPRPFPLFPMSEAMQVFLQMAGLKLAIVGSANLTPRQVGEASGLVVQLFDELRPTVLISGGATGVDTIAENWASAVGIEKCIFRPTAQNWKAFKVRNMKIAAECDALVRIVKKDSKTYGSGWTRDRAKGFGKPTKEFIID